MKLTITTPMARVVDAADVTYVRAEDETGAFGIYPGHADFLTTLAVSVVTWRDGESEHNVAVRGGVLTVHGGENIAIVTRQAVGEATLAELGHAVVAELKRDAEAAADSRRAGTRLELAAMRQIQRYLTTGRVHFARGGPQAARPADDASGDGIP